MNFYILIFTLLVFSGCVSHATSVSEDGKTAQPTPAIENSNSNANSHPLYTDYQYDKVLLDKLYEENERFQIVPDEFKTVDFENFNYDFGRLKNGELERNQTSDRLDGAFIFHSGSVFFVDLIGDEKKEAVVFISRTSCGASCDGGADLVYFFSTNNGKVKLVDILKTGSRSSRCSLKSFTIKDKKIYIEQFGKCKEEPTYDKSDEFICKFCATDETQSTYSFTENKLIRAEVKTIETETVNVLYAPAFVSINE